MSDETPDIPEPPKKRRVAYDITLQECEHVIMVTPYADGSFMLRQPSGSGYSNVFIPAELIPEVRALLLLNGKRVEDLVG